MVYFFKEHLWKRIVLVASTVPLAIVTNSLRIAMTAILYKYFGAEVAEGFFHTFSGLLIFVLCLPVLFLELKILSLLPPRQTDGRPGSEAREAGVGQPAGAVADADASPGTDRPAPLQIAEVIRQPVFIVALVLLSVTWAVSGTVDFREKIPAKKSLNDFPLNVGQWHSRALMPLDQIFLDALDLSEYAMADYFDSDGKGVNLYVAYYQSQSKGQSIHSPASCLPGSGWTFDQSGTVRIDNVPGASGSLRVNRAVMQLGRAKQISYYWFAARGRVLNNAYQLKIYNFWDALTRQRTDGALVRLITGVYEGETTADAENRLKQFVRDVYPVLEDHLPGKEL
jgi:exosortase D (VPLPA-CTERM-specific)